jgi:predicted aldo/keto reductase-like oxidoreductase
VNVSVDRATDLGFYRRLGRTGLSVSAVGIGAGGVDDPALITRAVDAGLNFIDTSVCYGDSELVIARALKQRPDIRDKLFIATKWDVKANDSKQQIMQSLDRSLERLGVTYIDVMQVHWLGGGHVNPDNGFNRLDNPALYEAIDAARASGKARWFGATSHHANRSKILQHAIDKGAFETLLVKMNLLDNEDAAMPELLAKAKKHDVGVVLMKTQPGGGEMPPGFENSKWSVYQANLRWALKHDIACIVHSGIGDDAETQDAAIEAARSELTERQRDREGALLEQYAVAMSPRYCRGCDDVCGAACPEGLAIAPVQQFAMYHRAYRWPERAKQHYARLPAASRWSERCVTCSACSEACPYGYDAAAGMREAKRLLDTEREPVT